MCVSLHSCAFHVLLLKEALKPVTAFRFGCGPNLPALLPLLLVFPPPSPGDRRPQTLSPLSLPTLTPATLFTARTSPPDAAALGLGASNWRAEMLTLRFGRVNQVRWTFSGCFWSGQSPTCGLCVHRPSGEGAATRKINLLGFVSQIQAVLMGSAKANRKITR